MMPIAFKIIHKYHIYDYQNERKKHKGQIGFLGGLVIFTSFIISYGIWFPTNLIRPDFSHNLVMSLFAIFILGFADDFLSYTSTKKFLFQFCVSSIFVIKSGLIIHFNEIFPLIPSSSNINIILTIVIMSMVINSINLIDGADGVATSIGIAAAFIFSIIFIYNKDFYFATLALSLTGSLIGFFYYNKPNAKIYMGDSGSTFIGMLLSFFMLRLINSGISLYSDVNQLNLKLSFGVVSIPLIDMLRVMFIRIFKGKHPFVGDRTHLHHKLEDIGLSKLYVILFISVINLINVSFVFNVTQNLFFYLVSISLLYSIMLIFIDIFNRYSHNQVHDYTINRNKLNKEMMEKKDRLYN